MRWSDDPDLRGRAKEWKLNALESCSVLVAIALYIFVFVVVELLLVFLWWFIGEIEGNLPDRIDQYRTDFTVGGGVLITIAATYKHTAELLGPAIITGWSNIVKLREWMLNRSKNRSGGA